jgi:hypothetical protein
LVSGRTPPEATPHRPCEGTRINHPAPSKPDQRFHDPRTTHANNLDSNRIGRYPMIRRNFSDTPGRNTQPAVHCKTPPPAHWFQQADLQLYCGVLIVPTRDRNTPKRPPSAPRASVLIVPTRDRNVPPEPVPPGGTPVLIVPTRDRNCWVTNRLGRGVSCSSSLRGIATTAC